MYSAVVLLVHLVEEVCDVAASSDVDFYCEALSVVWQMALVLEVVLVEAVPGVVREVVVAMVLYCEALDEVVVAAVAGEVQVALVVA